MALREHHSIQLCRPEQVLAGPDGDIWIADTGHHRVIGADRSGHVHTVVGGDRWPGGDPGFASAAIDDALFSAPVALALSVNERELFVADSRSHFIWHIDIHARVARPIAGNGECAVEAMRAGVAMAARRVALSAPCGLALDEDAGALYIAMAHVHQIWCLWLRTGEITALAGDGRRAYRDGPGLEAAFAEPRGLALAPDRRRLYIADAGNAALRVLDRTRAEVSTLVSASRAGAGDGTPASASTIGGCVAVTVSPAGLVIIDDRERAMRGVNIRHGTVTPPLVVASASIARPASVAMDRHDKSFIVSDADCDRVLRIARDLTRADAIALSR